MESGGGGSFGFDGGVSGWFLGGVEVCIWVLFIYLFGCWIWDAGMGLGFGVWGLGFGDLEYIGVITG